VSSNCHWIIVALLTLLTLAQPAQAKRPNVLFIAVDDLRPELGCYGERQMITPRLDQLARQGRLFKRHYVQVPTCGASRFALLTGLRPSFSRALGNGAFGRLSRANNRIRTLPQILKQSGYETVCIGKISHSPDGKVYTYRGKGDGHREMPGSWTRLATPYGKWKYGWGAFFGYSNGIGRTFHPHPTPTEMADVDDRGYPDGLIADAALEELDKLKDKPFFLAVGFYKPHLPFNAPKKYWDLYDRSKIKLSPNPTRPGGINRASWHGSGEMFGRYRHPKQRRGKAHALRLRHGYFACVSYIDTQIGKLLDRLRQLKLDKNTIVIVWGDHGWHLGDHFIWGKHSLFDRALRSALIIRVPGQKSPGVATSGIAETLDLMPTIADYCQVMLPANISGKSLRGILDDPNQPGKKGAFGYWRAGVSLRTRRWRLTSYKPLARKGKKPDPVLTELYDHRRDPWEMNNVAAKHPDVVKRLFAQLRRDG